MATQLHAARLPAPAARRAAHAGASRGRPAPPSAVRGAGFSCAASLRASSARCGAASTSHAEGLASLHQARAHLCALRPAPRLAAFRAHAVLRPPQLRNVVEAQQFDRPMLEALFEIAAEMEAVQRGTPAARALHGYIMATLFYEPSTRTRLSFEAAMRRLGGTVLTTESAGEYSSAAKGETLEDTMRTVDGYCDVIVLRHFQSGSAARAAGASARPLINAGDGPGQHPTQALLDVYTIRKELGRLDKVRVALVGDLANGRTVRSLAYLLSKFEEVELVFVAPDVVRMGDDIKDFLTQRGVKWSESDDLLAVAASCDVLYQTRIQKERFVDRPADYEKAKGKYIVTRQVMDALPKSGIVMHPLPRLDEITTEVDADPRAAYFRQAQNGLYIRMALLKVLLLNK